VSAIAVGAVPGAPGATTTVLALAAVWPADRRLLVVEADPDGGVLAARRGLTSHRGLVGAVASLLRGRRADEHTQPLGDTVEVMVAPTGAEQLRATLTAMDGDRWSALLSDDGSTTPGRDVIVDCGRLHAGSPTVDAARRADVALLVTRPRLDQVALLQARVPALRLAGVDPRVVLIDDGPYTAQEVAVAAGVRIAGVLPRDPRTAAALNGERARQRLGRSRLLRGARQLVGEIADVDPDAQLQASAT
jgi:MinD-like ATPase involved in chromosome partitioning or flagellar assembly